MNKTQNSFSKNVLKLSVLVTVFTVGTVWIRRAYTVTAWCTKNFTCRKKCEDNMHCFDLNLQH